MFTTNLYQSRKFHLKQPDKVSWEQITTPFNLALYKFKLFVTYLHIGAESKKAGGQAVLEGVMMRGKDSFATAVLKPNGEIVCKKEPFISFVKKSKLLALPIVRGFVQLAESLYIGIKSLNYSADIAMEEERKKEGKEESENNKNNWLQSVFTVLTIGISFAIAMGVFMYVPLLVSNFFKKNSNPLVFNAIAGAIRILFLLTYMWGISMLKDIRRVFEFHGAEHKAIFAYEADEELIVENTRKYTTYHPRCGTSFLLIVGIVCIFVFAIIDSLINMFIGPYPTLFHRFIVHTVLIPLVSGVSYEVLKLTDKGKNNFIVSMLIQPGLWLQRITTKPPSDKQIEVAFTSLKEVI